MDSPLIVGLLASLVPIGIVNIGALIYYAGVMTATLKDHDRRISHLEGE